MLVLSRKPEQAVIIDDEIVVRILEVRGDQVRIGIEAPKDVVILRDEVARAIAESTR
jgi:carbon storage regulator